MSWSDFAKSDTGKAVINQGLDLVGRALTGGGKSPQGQTLTAAAGSGTSNFNIPSWAYWAIGGGLFLLTVIALLFKRK